MAEVANVVLAGFMGTGKTTVGKLVAKQLGFEFVDTDALIERQYGPIPHIFADKGEAVFREMERDIVADLAGRSDHVIATGGRLLLDPVNIDAFAAASRIFCLSASIDEIAARVDQTRSLRPLLDVDDPHERIRELLAERGPHYRRFVQVPTNGRLPSEVADDIVERCSVEAVERLIVRPATPDDAEQIHRFIHALAVYEREPDAVEATPSIIRDQMLSSRPPFECLVAEVGTDARSVPVGFALFFTSYSTWKGRSGIFLEDLFVMPEHRGTGAGKALLAALAQVTNERDYARLEWQVLDWNEPSIRFYEALGADVMREWLPCRVSGDELMQLAEAGLG
ncbi:MAG: GNAT family N-acetyltransferase [Actinomycetia bacterium]|nr:GNAT family N-acetyltransferase [Actinomycetes bacterium]